MGQYIVIPPVGEPVTHEGGKKLELKRVYELGGFDCAAPLKVRWEGRARDAYVDDNGFMNIEKTGYNPRLRQLCADYYRVNVAQIQHFAGTAVIWVPTPTARHPYENIPQE
jgi:hypothetical protein